MQERKEGEVTLTSKLRDQGFAFNNRTFEKARKMSEKTFQKEEDKRFWEPKRDKSGNGYALVRFFPDKNLSSEFQIVEHLQHYYQGSSGKYYVENCPTMAGQPCPVCEAIAPLWQTGEEKDKDLYRLKKKHHHYICNIYIIEDPVEPENSGKVFLYEVPNDIFKKIMEKLEPKFPGEIKMNVFNPLESSNFKIKVFTESKQINNKKVGVRNYTLSAFSETIEPVGDDAKINEIWQQCWDLKQLLTEKKYAIRSYDEIKKRYEEFCQHNSGTFAASASAPAPSAPDIKDVQTLFAKTTEQPSTPASAPVATPVTQPAAPAPAATPAPAPAAVSQETQRIENELIGLNEAAAKNEEIKMDADSIFRD